MPFLRKTGRRSPRRPPFDKAGYFICLFVYFPFALQGEMPPELQTTYNKAKSYFSQNRQTALAANFQISILRANMQTIWDNEAWLFNPMNVK